MVLVQWNIIRNNKILLIAYNDGNIDILENNKITNIPDLKNNSISGSKVANHIFFRNNYAYISYSFGILVIDLVKFEIKDNYIIGSGGSGYPVYSVAADDSNIYAATGNGIFSASVNNPFLVDYTQWHLVTNIPNYTSKFDKLCYFNGMIIANSVGANTNSDQLFYLKNNVWTSFLPQANMHKYEVRPWGNWLMITGDYAVFQLGQNLKLVNSFFYSNPVSSLVDNFGIAWFADSNLGLVYCPPNSQNFTSICPNGPATADVWRMQYYSGSIYVTAGGADQSWTPTFTQGKLYKFSNQTWTSIINTSGGFDYSSIAVDPVNPNKVYVGSWADGVIVYNNGQLINNYTYTNSPLQTLIPGKSYVYVNGTSYDAANNLWVTNSLASAPLKVLKTDGTWKSFSFNNLLQNVEAADILPIDHTDPNPLLSYHYIWIVLPRNWTEGWGSGLLAFNYNGTIDNTADDAWVLIKPLNIYSQQIYNVFCATLDNNGEVWAGTEQGVVVYTDPTQVFSTSNPNTVGIQPAIPANNGTNIVYPLLGGQSINCIVVDGANQKWIGTQSGGAYLVSADGTKQIYNFNTTNSPIFSNNVLAIAIDASSGEVFFGTDKGIISYRAVATQGNEDFSHVYVYPDPVRDNYHGNIIITGLMTNTIVKITDISGDLVYETISEGGQAVWDGNLVNTGRRVASGVYLVFLTTEDGSKTFVTKMLVIH